jgi:hypothetical protein
MATFIGNVSIVSMPVVPFYSEACCAPGQEKPALRLKRGRLLVAEGQFGCFMSTLLPITPPRMAPAAAPINPPFTLSRLLTAPITAPVAAPIAASRVVCFTTGCGAGW